ncbi:hypothetical protein NW759_016727, partial [Fusarium solani]
TDTVPKDDEDLDCLYENQWSCVVTGHNNIVWSAYAFTDTYLYDPGETSDRASFQYFHRLQEDEEVFERDPIHGLESNMSKDPREYFLLALSERVPQVVEEWTNAIFMFKRKVEQYIRT